MTKQKTLKPLMNIFHKYILFTEDELNMHVLKHVIDKCLKVIKHIYTVKHLNFFLSLFFAFNF